MLLIIVQTNIYIGQFNVPVHVSEVIHMICIYKNTININANNFIFVELHLIIPTFTINIVRILSIAVEFVIIVFNKFNCCCSYDLCNNYLFTLIAKSNLFKHFSS